MIIKSFEEKKINLTTQKIHLLYGDNQGHINDLIDKAFKKKFDQNIYQYEETEIIKNEDLLFEKLQNKSFFDNKKLIIINRTSDKIRNLIEKVLEKNFEDINIVLTSNILEKKSKLRTFFEKEKNLICIPFYKDTDQSLVNLVTNFCNEKKISLSRHIINLIIKRSMNDRQNLKNELQKVEAYLLNKREIDEETILKLTNLSENHSISALIDNCLIKNEKKIKEILNENNFSVEDCIQIMRMFLIKTKKLLTLSKQVEITKNIHNTIEAAKPPIFWKDKEITKKQLELWTNEKVSHLITRINLTELLIKKNSINSVQILLNFIFEETSTESNNTLL